LQVRPPCKIYGRRVTAAANALVEVKIDSSESVSALAESLVAKLQLGVPSDRIVLTIVNEGGATVKELSDPKATLDASGVTSGATVVVSVQPPAASASVEAGASRRVCTRRRVTPMRMRVSRCASLLAL